jgi:hypothetical protein
LIGEPGRHLQLATLQAPGSLLVECGVVPCSRNHVDHNISGFSCSHSTSAAQRLSVSPQLVCAVVVYLRTGPDQYQAYSLEGGP